MEPTLQTADVRRPPSLRAGVVIVLGCLALGGISAMELRFMSEAHGNPVPWASLLVSTMPRWAVLAAALPWVFVIGVGTPGSRGPRTIAMQVVAFLAVSLLHAWITTFMAGLAMPIINEVFPWWARLLRSWYNTLPMTVALYSAVLVGSWAVTETRERQRRTLRASQLETQLRSAQLEALRTRLQPHFLYNTLNGIAAMVAALEPNRAVAAIEQLGELLHASLRDDGREEIPIVEEIRLAEQYLALQRMRFGERLRHESRIHPLVADCAIPVLLLQPIVENAVVHGLDAGTPVLTVTIAAEPCDGGVVLRVENDGTALDRVASQPAGQGSGVGVAATRARLATRYGDDASLRLLEREGGGVTVEIRLPAIRLASDGGRSAHAAESLAVAS